MPPCKNTLSVAKPNPGLGLPNTYDEFAKPLKSPNLDLNSTSYSPLPVLSTISMNGVFESLGFAFILIYPLPLNPVDTITCPSSYDCDVEAKSPTKLPPEPLP